jgi:hypothetical protein
MIRFAAALLFAGCLTLQVWSQDKPEAKLSGQGSGTEQAPTVPGVGKTVEIPQGRVEQSAPAKPAQPVAKEMGVAPTGWPLEAFREFSAVVTGSYFPDDERLSYIYRSGDQVRTSGPGPKTYMISNLKTVQVIGVSPKGCTKIGTLFFRVFPFNMSKPEYKYERKEAGTETVDGHECHVEDVSVTDDTPRKPAKFRLWEADDLQGFPVKIDAENGSHKHSIIRYTRVVIGPQDPTLFLYPENCSASKSGAGGPAKKSAPSKPGGEKKATNPPN